MKKFSILLIAFVLSACASENLQRGIASPGSFSKGDGNIGNGGYGVVCYKKDKKTIVSVELLDIYEAKLKGLTLSSKFSEYNDNEELSFADLHVPQNTNFGKLISSLFIPSPMKNDVYKTMAKIRFERAFLPAETTFNGESNDAVSEFVNEKCALKQIAMFKPDNRLYIKSVFWNKLDNLNKFALLLHEALFKIRREKFGDTESSNARFATAILLSDYNGLYVSLELDNKLKNLLLTQNEIDLFTCYSKIENSSMPKDERAYLPHGREIFFSGMYYNRKFCDVRAFTTDKNTFILDFKKCANPLIKVPDFISFKCDERGVCLTEKYNSPYSFPEDLKVEKIGLCSFRLIRDYQQYLNALSVCATYPRDLWPATLCKEYSPNQFSEDFEIK